MPLIERTCPICKANDYSVVLNLQQDHFTKVNPTYRLERIPEMNLDPNQLYPIVKCNKCNMVYSYYHLDDKAEGIVYNRIINTELSRTKSSTLEKRIGCLRIWLSLLTTIKNKETKKVKTKELEKLDLKVLDYGCGWGTLLQIAKGPGVRVIGFDVSSAQVEWNRQQGITVYESEKKLLDEAPFDICISISVLEHLRHPLNAVNMLRRLLKPGGYAFITCIVHNAHSLNSWRKNRKKLHLCRPLNKEINPWEHLNYFTRETLSKIMQSSGFVPVRPSYRLIEVEKCILQSVRFIIGNYLSLIRSTKNSPIWRLEK